MSSQPQIEKEPVAVQEVEKVEAETQQEEKQRAEKISQDDESEKLARKPQIWGYCHDTSMGPYGFDL